MLSELFVFVLVFTLRVCDYDRDCVCRTVAVQSGSPSEYVHIYIYTCTMHYFSQDILIVFHLYKLFFVFFNFCFWIPLRSHTNVSTQFQIHSQTIAYAQMLLVFFSFLQCQVYKTMNVWHHPLLCGNIGHFVSRIVNNKVILQQTPSK